LAQISRPDSSAVRIDENSSNEEVSNVQKASLNNGARSTVRIRQRCAAQLPAGGGPTQGQLPLKKPNIIFVMGDNVGWFNIGAYHRGMMSGKTPNLDSLAAQGMISTDYYAEASCTAGRANFITGELPIRTGLTTVGQAGADVGLPAEASTIAVALKSVGHATGQFGKSHLGDLNKFVPTVHDDPRGLGHGKKRTPTGRLTHGLLFGRRIADMI
jgi:hypothetical protein